MALAPFILDVALLPKTWGGRRLGALYADSRSHLGEAWLCADLAETAQSGAGGQAMISAVCSAPSASRAVAATGATGSAGGPDATPSTDLHAVLARDPIGLLGFHAERFPLLVKFLDAAEHLSVQVHPSPAYARTHPGARLKSEAWVVLEAEPGAELMLGLNGVADGSALAAAARDGSLPDRLVRVPAIRGAACWLPSGLVHALGAGSLVFEVQTASDTTYRLYDWTALYGRAPRAMHIEVGVEAARLDAAPVWGPSFGEAEGGPILATPDFAIGVVAGPSVGPVIGPLGASTDPRAVLVVPVGASALLTGSWGRLEAPAHRVTVVPASVVGDCRVELPAAARAFVVRVLGG